uniref:Uncharacterized protein n=1 Tax=Trichuris muris TaxID=70415 RepID=A0A5S6Q7D6_TRIMR
MTANTDAPARWAPHDGEPFRAFNQSNGRLEKTRNEHYKCTSETKRRLLDDEHGRTTDWQSKPALIPWEMSRPPSTSAWPVVPPMDCKGNPYPPDVDEKGKLVLRRQQAALRHLYRHFKNGTTCWRKVFPSHFASSTVKAAAVDKKPTLAHMIYLLTVTSISNHPLFPSIRSPRCLPFLSSYSTFAGAPRCSRSSGAKFHAKCFRKSRPGAGTKGSNEGHVAQTPSMLQCLRTA